MRRGPGTRRPGTRDQGLESGAARPIACRRTWKATSTSTTRCIDCDACRQIAPATFRDHGDQSSVGRQPSTPEDIHRALMALVACPTASIGTISPAFRRGAREAARAFPSRVFENVFFCGYTAEASFGAWSYLIVRDQAAGGNVLVDSPRFAGPLVRRIEEMGGVTHDVSVASRRHRRPREVRRALPLPAGDASGRRRRAAGNRAGDRRGGAGCARRGPGLHPDAGSHPRPSGVAVSRYRPCSPAIISRGRRRAIP